MVKAVLGEGVGEDLDGAVLLETDLGMAGDVVGHGEEFGVHELAGAGDDLVASGVGGGDGGDEVGDVEGGLELGAVGEDLLGGDELGGSFLSAERSGGEEGGGDDGEDAEVQAVSPAGFLCCRVAEGSPPLLFDLKSSKDGS
jgi:hypothetical protein